MVSAEFMYLSAPSASEDDIESVVSALRGGWLAPLGPELLEFEQAVASYLGVRAAVGLNSGTAAIHLALRYMDVQPGDLVLVPTVTFAATAFPVLYLGATPVFVDIDESWNMDPHLVDTALGQLSSRGLQVKAAVPVDLYGSPADYGNLLSVLGAWSIPILEDSAEALGASSGLGRCGSFGRAGVLSFNGNKIMTTSGGGMLASDDVELVDTVRKWSSQSRDDFPWYEHSEVGFNHRLSNVLAALGLSQFSRIELLVAQRRKVRELYRNGFCDIDGIAVQEDPSWGQSNAWLTVIRLDRQRFPNGPTIVREYLAERQIEARHIWKPMHQQPIFAQNPSFLNGQADALFAEGLCLPSGSSLTNSDIERVVELVLEALGIRR